MLSQFAGYQGVDSVGQEVGNGALPAAGKDGDTLGVFASVFDRLIRFGEAGFKFLGELLASTLWSFGNNGDVLVFVRKKGIDWLEFEGLGEQDVVANFRMAIKREMRTVNC